MESVLSGGHNRTTGPVAQGQTSLHGDCLLRVKPVTARKKYTDGASNLDLETSTVTLMYCPHRSSARQQTQCLRTGVPHRLSTLTTSASAASPSPRLLRTSDRSNVNFAQLVTSPLASAAALADVRTSHARSVLSERAGNSRSYRSRIHKEERCTAECGCNRLDLGGSGLGFSHLTQFDRNVRECVEKRASCQRDERHSNEGLCRERPSSL